MSDFSKIQGELNKARTDHSDADKKIFALKQELQLIEDKIQKLKRSINDQNETSLIEKEKLEKRRRDIGEEIDILTDKNNGFKKNVNELFTSFIKLSDPTKQVEELSDAFPFLLMPLRIETRFKEVKDNPPGSRLQLWVRIYPDTCHIESKEEILSQFEVQNAKQFWMGMWAAGANEAQERGAWKSLVNSHGSGRSSWIIEQYKPTNLAAKPVKVDATDIILVIASELTLSASEEAAAFVFWKDIWLADGDNTKEALALQTLKANVGNAKAEEIQNEFRPFNLTIVPQQGKKKNEIALSASRITFPADGTIPVSKTSWQQAPRAKLLPDRFVVTCFKKGQLPKQTFTNAVQDSLAVGPDPSLPDSEQMRSEKGELNLNKDLQWMADFDKAIEVGMGVKINLTAAEYQDGFDSMIVLGLKLSMDKDQSQHALENLLLGHYYSSHGFGLLPQGIPTNNTDGEGSGFSRIDDPDRSYNIIFKQEEQFNDDDDAFTKKDGQWLAEILGVESDVLKKVPFAGGSDQSEARALNTALWPATLGYFMDEMMGPVFTDQQIDSTRNFFQQYVSGRGSAPAIRIGKQPYGILPASVFSRLDFAVEHSPAGIALFANTNKYFKELHELLKKIDADWDEQAKKVSCIGKQGDAHKILLDILGLHPTSVEFHQRYAESLQHVYNQLNLAFGPFIGTILSSAIEERGKTILSELGYDPEGKKIPILEKFFMGKANPLTGPLIDDVPLSESKEIREYTTDKKNYIEWLVTSKADIIRQENFGAGKVAPNALLYLLLRHSMMQAHAEAIRYYYLSKQLINDKKAFHDPDFIHIGQQESSKSKWAFFYQTNQTITGDTTTLLADHILKPVPLQNDKETKNLKRILDAMKSLVHTPTARLERLFAEHLDICNYRLDSWKNGMIHAKLTHQRKLNMDDKWSKGIYIGAYGYLENLRSENKQFSNVELTGDLNTIFNKPGEPKLQSDSTNAGYIHAPSINQAATAAILRNAYLSNATKANPQQFSVNISSERVRLAQGFLEGVRNGQSLAALLGYQFERGLHDKYSLGKGEVDKFIFPLRKKFPLVSNQMNTTKTTAQENKESSIEAIEARNVIDGLKLIKHIQSTTNKIYPFGFATGTEPDKVPAATSKEQAAINEEVDRILDINDAISDIVMAESVYQVVQGNIERAAGNAEAFSKGMYPPEIEVVKTPRSGITLTHRVAVQLDPDADPATSPNTVANMTARSKADAPINKWLSSVMPDPKDVGVWVKFKDPSMISEDEKFITQVQLGLQSIDLLNLLQIDTEQSQTQMDDRIISYVKKNHNSHPYAGIKIEYTRPADSGDSSKVSFFELGALTKSLRTIVTRSRHLHGGDHSLPQEAKENTFSYNVDQLKTRVKNAADDLDGFTATLTVLETDASDIDDYAKKVRDEFLEIAEHGIPQANLGFIAQGMHDIYDSVYKKLEVLLKRWKDKESDYTTIIGGYSSAGPANEMFELLRDAEKIISATLTEPLPADHTIYKSTIVDVKKNAFDIVHNALKPLVKSNKTKLTTWFADVDATLALIKDRDAAFFDTKREMNDVQKEKDDAARLRDEIKKSVTRLKDDIAKRVTDANKLINDIVKEKSDEKKIEMLINAAKLVLGDDVKLVPRYTIDVKLADELGNSVTDSLKLLDFIRGNEKIADPVEHWFYGTARVRPKMYHLENAAILSENFKPTARFNLTPLQLPYKGNDRWLAMKFRTEDNLEKFAIGSDTLLYTVHYAVPFNKLKPQCGLLVDEWTEVIPAKEETTGIAFHYDQPNTEPPQVMLVAVPPKLTGKWQWKDLIDTIHETMDMAKKRAVEPAQLETTAYAQFLPTTMMAVTLYLITLSTNLAINNSVYEKI